MHLVQDWWGRLLSNRWWNDSWMLQQGCASRLIQIGECGEMNANNLIINTACLEQHSIVFIFALFMVHVTMILRVAKKNNLLPCQDFLGEDINAGWYANNKSMATHYTLLSFSPQVQRVQYDVDDCRGCIAKQFACYVQCQQYLPEHRGIEDSLFSIPMHTHFHCSKYHDFSLDFSNRQGA